MQRRVVAVVVALGLWAACGDNDPGLQLQVYGEPALVAYRDGDIGDWQLPHVTAIDSNGLTYDLNVTDDYTLVVVCINPLGPRVEQIEAVRSDGLRTVGGEGVPCGSLPPSSSSPVFYHAHASLARAGEAWLDGAEATSTSTSAPYTYEADVYSEVYDLIAIEDDGAAIRRGISVHDENQTELDVHAEGLPWAKVPVAVSGLDNTADFNSFFEQYSLVTERGAAFPYYLILTKPGVPTAFTANFVQPFQLEDGDRQDLYLDYLNSAETASINAQHSADLAIVGTAIVGPQRIDFADLSQVAFGIDSGNNLVVADLGLDDVSAIEVDSSGNPCDRPRSATSIFVTAGWLAHQSAASIPIATDVPGFDPTWQLTHLYNASLEVTRTTRNAGATLTTTDSINHQDPPVPACLPLTPN